MDPETQSEETVFYDTEEYLSAIKTDRDREYQTTMTAKDERQPVKEFACMMAYVQINGQMALVLFDSGSSINAISSSFATVHKTKNFTLKSPVCIQMGCTGSQGIITTGTNASLTLGPKTETTYFDILNMDHYNVILEVGLMLKFKIHLDFEHQKIQFSDTTLDSLPPPKPIGYKRTVPRGTASKYQWAHQRGDESKKEE